MGHSSAIKLHPQPRAFSPFWTKPETKGSKTKAVFKQIFKWTKLAIFLFFMVIGLWGCTQSMWDSSISSDPTIGQGLEFGYDPGTTGDYRFDLNGNYEAFHNSFSHYTLDYGPFYGWFVYPGAALTLSIMWSSHNWWGGLNALIALFTLLVIIRSLTILVTLRSTMQNERMQEVQGKMAEINAKYKDLKDMASRQKKQQETMELYRKHKVKPFAAFEQMFLTLPIFMIIYRVVSILRPMKATNLFNIWNFGAVPTTQIFSNFTNGGWTFIFFLLIIIPVQVMSSLVPQMLAKKRNRNAIATTQKGGKQMKRTKIMQYVFIGVMVVVVSMSATGVGVYWFFNGLFGMAQAAILHVVILKSRKKHGSVESRLAKLGIE